ncbi:hypothetical protein Rsub_07546 [Raphidocelis subcapitata]|uniref:MYND-type domain-containing protein n=1 Tax=Raphidocelis subcapitata TaxID=307507 RepID=A0A2V0PD65_9CHLO|nr:hypothetical protein Rsub_07546 [Raphidocelis subcapitata]|eukprot:GBF95045.1 hypothetical protein Rsub_07546 [Raphidocelis subcapitata]
MAGPAAAARAAARQRLAADLRELGAALNRHPQSGLAPEVQELISSWDPRSRALLDAADDTEGGLEGAAATAAAALLRPLLSAAFASAHPDLFVGAAKAATSALQCCGIEASSSLTQPVAYSLLGLFFDEQLDTGIRSGAAEVLANLPPERGCAASLLAAPAAEGAVEALIAAAKREGDPHQDSAFVLLAVLAAADGATADRISSPEAALLPIAVERIRSLTADGPQSLVGRSFFGPLRLLTVLTSAAPDAARVRARAVPGLVAAAVDLLMALAAAEQAAEAAAQRAACHHDEMATQCLAMLSEAMLADRLTRALAIGAMVSGSALPRVLALLRSPGTAVRHAACRCVSTVAGIQPGRDALFKVPRAASELAAALRRAYADGEDPALTQFQAAAALAKLLDHGEGRRVAEALARDAAAEGAAATGGGTGGSLLGALAGLIAASVDEASGSVEVQLSSLWGAVTLLCRMVWVLEGSALAAEQVRALHRAAARAPRLTEACVVGLEYWLPKARATTCLHAISELVYFVAFLAGIEEARRGGARPPAAAADTAAARAALRGAPGLGAGLRLFLYRQPGHSSPVSVHNEVAVTAAKWLLRLPEVEAPAAAAAAAATSSAAAVAARAAPTAASPASAVHTAAQAAQAQAPATAAAVPLPAAAGGRSVAAPPLALEGGGSSSSRAGDGSGPSSIGGGAGAQAAVPRVCGACGRKSTADARLLRCVGCKAQYYCNNACALSHWAAHQAACRAAAAAAAASPAAGPPSAALTPAQGQVPAATAPAVPPPAAAGGRSVAAQRLAPQAGGSSTSRADGSGSSSSRADGSGSSSTSGSGDGGGSSSAAGSDSNAEAAAQPRACGACGRESAADSPLLRCVGCKAQYYCGDACAKAQWPSHRAECKATRRAARRTAAAQRS